MKSLKCTTSKSKNSFFNRESRDVSPDNSPIPPVLFSGLVEFETQANIFLNIIMNSNMKATQPTP